MMTGSQSLKEKSKVPRGGHYSHRHCYHPWASFVFVRTRVQARDLEARRKLA